jgi:hypothetical protein
VAKKFKSGSPVLKELEYLATDVATCWDRVKMTRAEHFAIKERLLSLEQAFESFLAEERAKKSNLVEKTP